MCTNACGRRAAAAGLETLAPFFEHIGNVTGDHYLFDTNNFVLTIYPFDQYHDKTLQSISIPVLSQTHVLELEQEKIQFLQFF